MTAKLFDKEQEKEIVSLYNTGKSVKDISLLFGVGPSTIRRYLHRQNVKLNNVKLYDYDVSYFKYINDANKAYWLGFIMADGYLSKNNSYLRLKIKDYEHLEKFKHDIQYNGPIRFEKDVDAYSVSICSKRLTMDLNNLGILSNKSFSTVVPDIHPHLIRHFIRGVWDGDGSITYNKRKKWSLSLVSATLEFIKAIKKIIESSCGSSGYIQTRTSNVGNKYYVLHFSGTPNAFKIADFLYNASTIYLDRKYDRYIKMKSYINRPLIILDIICKEYGCRNISMANSLCDKHNKIQWRRDRFNGNK